MPAFSEAEGSKALAGVLLAAWSCGSGAAGLAWGARASHFPLLQAHMRFALLLPLAIAPLALAFSPLTMGILVVLSGLPIAPLIASRNQLVERVTPAGTATEAFTWPLTALVDRRLPRRRRGRGGGRVELVDGLGDRRGRRGDARHRDRRHPPRHARAGDPLIPSRRTFDIDLMLNVRRVGQGPGHTPPGRVARMGVIKGDKSVEIEAPIERCYEIAADIENAMDWQGSLKDVEVLERDGERRPELVETESDAKVKSVQVRAALLLRPAHRDPLGAGEGRHQVADRVVDASRTWAAGRTRATYGLEADPGRMLGLLLRGPAESKVRDFLLGGAAEGLKQKAEA